MIHDNIKNDGILIFEMGPEPSQWAQTGGLPPSFSSKDFNIIDSDY